MKTFLDCFVYLNNCIDMEKQDKRATKTIKTKSDHHVTIVQDSNTIDIARPEEPITQDKIIDDANETLNLENVSNDEMSEAQKNVEEILKNFTIQDSIESIVKAKGFSECLCYISDEGVTIIVPDSELNDTSALVIDDAVTSHYEVDYEDISIVGA